MYEKEIKLPKSITVDINKYTEWIEGLIEMADALEKSERGIGADEYFHLLGYIKAVKSLLPKNKI